jgi:hypothetical protein
MGANKTTNAIERASRAAGGVRYLIFLNLIYKLYNQQKTIEGTDNRTVESQIKSYHVLIFL